MFPPPAAAGGFSFYLAGNPASCSSGRRKVELSGKTTGFRYLSRNEPSPAAKAGAPPGLSSIAFRRNALPSQCDDPRAWEIPSKRRFRRTWPRKHCLPISSGPAAGISLAYLCPDLAAWLRHFVATSLLPSMPCSQFATMEPLSIRWTPGRPIGWPGSEFRTPAELLRVVPTWDNSPARIS